MIKVTAAPPEAAGSSNGREAEGPGRYHQPTARECALLLLRLMQAREQEVHREVSRARISQNTIRKLCGRSQIANDLLLEIQEYLLAAGWSLFCLGPTHYAVIKVKSVEGWGRISSKRIDDELKAVSLGRYDFEQLEPLLIREEPSASDEE